MSNHHHASFASRLSHNIHQHGTSLCVGIDPDLDNSPVFAREWVSRHGGASYLEHFSRNLIEASSGIVPAVKFQSAFFESFGAAGFGVLKHMINLARTKGLLTILDAKRGDISSTMRAYGEMAFHEMQADSMTVTPYMGTDTVAPLVPWLRKGHGIYLVWVTSNPGGSLVQDCTTQPTGARLSTSIFKEFSNYFEQQGVSDCYGWVVGATRLKAIDDSIRPAVWQAPTLIPGIGAQGGEISPELRSMIASKRALVPQSRGLSKGPADLSDWHELYEFSRDRISRAALSIGTGA